MKKEMIVQGIAVLCVVLFASTVFGGEGSSTSGSQTRNKYEWFKPSISVGYAVDIASTHYTFSSSTFVGLGGVSKFDLKPARYSGVYLAGELPFQLSDRFNLALAGSWMPLGSGRNMGETDTSSIGTVGSRRWDFDGENNMVTADLLASYAFIKNASFLKELSAVGGLRWDSQSMNFKNSRDSISLISSPTDSLDFDMQTLAPIFGLASTFKGFKSGIFGGDMKLGVLGGPILWGQLDYNETFGNIFFLRFKDNINNGYLFKISGEITALSGHITDQVGASLSIFSQFTKYNVGDRVQGRMVGAASGMIDYHFDTDSNILVFGLKGGLTF